MLISKLGEFGLIERFRKQIKNDSSVIKGSGDDCAVLRLDKGSYQLFTCDMIVEGVDFTLKDDPYLIGRKAIAISVSDIASCGGIPRYCVVSLAIPKNTTLGFADKIFKGMLDTARAYKVNIVGGDLSAAKRIVLDVSMLGIVEKKNLALRSRAKIGDIILVTGALGGSISGKHLRFTPRLKEARFLVNNFSVRAMIDISDGLIQDLRHILDQSRVGALLYEEFIPLSKEARGLNDALYSGEDFELLFTLSRKDAKALLKRRPDEFRAIGEIVDKSCGLRLVDKKNRSNCVKFKGYRHF
jgi:thiamine-monophosphate kinase